jgi:hypothetical protein
MNSGMTQHRMSLNVSVLLKKIKKRYNKNLILIRLLSAQFHLLIAVIKIQIPTILGGHHSHDRMVLDFQLPVQSVHITTNVVSSKPAQTRCTRYNIM